ncbi:MAG: aromatic ring-hydroxylating dioxygenase subunit alpha [Candidatus Omnitrophota bacterium]|nr:aromatic ring-hydroxylating dioxygenase subunit alpha [Candidatus Omnitrophota bacterium]
MREGNFPDLRNTGTHRDHWYPLARSHKLKPGKALAASFAGEPIALIRTQSGALVALEDRCAHRQVPLSAGVVDGERVRCGYHGWTYDGSGKCVDVPYLGKRDTLPNGVRSYPCREAYDFIFVFPGDPAKADDSRFPVIPTHADPHYKTRTLDREVRCHYSFMHENLLDMNHQFLHRRLMGGIRPTFLGLNAGEDWIEAAYTFKRESGRQSLGEKFMIGKRSGIKRREHDLMTIRTQYPYQILQFTSAEQEKPSLDLWLAYVPVDRLQRANHSMGLMMIRKPSIPGLLHLFWPFIVLFTEGIFAEDRRIVELEQKAYDDQGGDWNQEIFPVIRGLRELLVRQGVPLDEQDRSRNSFSELRPV